MVVNRAAVAAGFVTLRESIPVLQQAAHDALHRDTYTCWTVNRSTGWEDGESVEAKAVVESGTGKLRANGIGGPRATEMVISLESPYVFRTLASAAIAPGNLLVINATRLFRVDTTKPEHSDDLLMDVGVTELFTTPMPEVP